MGRRWEDDETPVNKGIFPFFPFFPLEKVLPEKTMLNFARKIIASPQPAPSFSALWQAADAQGRYELDERAAILEYEAGLDRTEAEARAVADFHRRKESEGR